MELSLDLSLASLPNPISLFLGDVSRSRDRSEKLTMLEGCVKRLEEEMKKVEAFKRELPLCSLLVKDVITKLKEEKMRMQEQDPAPVTEEFMPLKSYSEENGKGLLRVEKETCDKKNWLSSVQLWSSETKSRNEEDDRSVPENRIVLQEQKNNNGGSVMAFNGNSRIIEAVSKEVSKSKFPSFRLLTAASEFVHSNSKSGGGESRQSQPQPPQHMQQNPRKQRRCWSPELHRSFLEALQQLGGAKVATPKQIRELMNVEGLTNDEVKSHLQKYRLHVRRLPSSSTNSDIQANNSLWMNQDQSEDNKSMENSSKSVSPQGPLTPLLLGWSAKGVSSHGQNSVDAEEEHSDGHNNHSF